VVYVTRGLLEALLEFAASAEPERSNVVLTASPAGELRDETGLDPTIPVLSHFYFPETGASVSSVFGVDLATPAGSGRARFLSHPRGNLELTETDDLAAAVLVAVPPWSVDDVAAFDRSGARLELALVEAAPPREELT